jgi:hypothetical protein
LQIILVHILIFILIVEIYIEASGSIPFNRIFISEAEQRELLKAYLLNKISESQYNTNKLRLNNIINDIKLEIISIYNIMF